MKIIISSFFFFINTVTVNAQELDIINVRNLYYKAVESNEVIHELKNVVNNYKNDTCLIIGYTAATHMLQAKHSIDPITKYKWFVKGRNLFEETIQKNTQSIELRFLRYSIQKQLPSFLNYHSEIENDRDFILSNLVNIDDNDLEKKITSFLTNYP
mgnify:CR=1 FL=1